MMSAVSTAVHKGRVTFGRLMLDPRVQMYARAAAYVLSGFMLSAASLGNIPMPLSMGLVFGCSGWSAVLVCVGGLVGYPVFWGTAGQQGMVWLLCGLGIRLLLSNRRINRETPILLPALAALVVSASGVLFQTWFADTTPVGLYMLRVVLGGGSAWLFTRVLRGRNPILEWIAGALGVLALAQIAPLPHLGFGFIAGGVVCVAGAFPAAALAGVAMDLAGITPVSMTAVLCAGYLIRFLPKYPRWLGAFAPAAAYMIIMTLSGGWDLLPLGGLILGGIAGVALPLGAKVPARRGETGVAQVRLEMAAGALVQAQQVLLEVPQIPVDEEALVQRAAEQACLDCPYRKSCKDSRRIAQLPGAVLHKPLVTSEELPLQCRKSGRFLAQLHRGQEHLRSIRADRERQQEYRAAVEQQYRFMAEFLHSMSDQLANKANSPVAHYTPQVMVFGNRPEADNGDRCIRFAGIGCRYYVILCDGMGTGMGAVQESQRALQLLRRLLTAGYPADHALQSLNSLCALRGRAGAVTVDLLEMDLESGKAMLYKWGAAPSYVISPLGSEKIGTAGPPPGLSVTQPREVGDRLSLHRGETLVLVSDGVPESEAMQACLNMGAASPGEMARRLLTGSEMSGEDDATVVIVRLDPGLPTA